MIKKGNPTKDGKQYYFRLVYRDSFGNRKDKMSGKFMTKKEAQDAEFLFLLKNKENASISMNFKELYNLYLIKKKEELKPTTYVKLVNICKYFNVLDNIKVNDIKLEHINKLKENLKGSITYKNKILGTFKCVISFGNKYYNTSTECIKFCDKFVNTSLDKKEMEFFTIDEYKSFRSVIDDSTWLLFFDMLYYLGFRKGELQALTWKQIDLKKNELTINQSLTTKLKGIEYLLQTPKTKNSIRTLPIPKGVLDRLKVLKNDISEYSDFSSDWFVFGNSIPFKDTTIEKHKNKYCELSNNKKIRIHDFRHSCASLLINQGASIQLVSKYLGHSSIDITLRIYTHLYDNELLDIKKTLDLIV